MRAATYQPDGKLVVALSDGVNTRLVRYNVNGTADATFASPPLYKGSYRVTELLVRPSGRIIAFGNFLRLNGGVINALATNWISGAVAVNSNGAPDQSFNRFTGLEANSLGYQWVNTALPLPDGRILAVGEFGSWNGQPRNGLAMLFDTMVDPAFNQQVTAYTFNQGDNVVLNPLPFSVGSATWQWQRNGTNLVGQTGPTLSLNGVLPADTATYTLIGTSPYGTNSYSFTVVVLGKPQIVTQPAALPDIVVVNPFQLSVKAVGVAPLNYQWRRNGANPPGATSNSYTNPSVTLTDAGAYDVVIQNIHGSVTSVVVNVNVIIAPGSVSLGISNNVAGITRVVKERSGSFLLNFASSLTRFTQAGTFDNAFSNTLRTALGNVTISTMITDEFGRLYIATSSPLQVRRFLSGGLADTNYPTLTLSSTPNALTVTPNGTLFIGLNNSPGLFKVQPDGTTDTAFNTASATALNNAGVLAAQVQPDGRILVALSNGIRRLNANGTLDATFAANSIPGVRGFLLLSDDRFYAWGTFSNTYNVNGTNSTLRCLARFLPTGAVDATFAGPDLNNAFNGVHGISIEDSSRLIVVGGFTTANSVSRPYVLRLETNGTVDTTFNTGSGPNGIVYGCGTFGDGRVLIGGTFSQVNGISRNSLAVLNGDLMHLGFTAEPVSTVLDQGQPLTLSGSAYGTSAITYEWLRNGVSIANGATYFVPNVTTNEAGLYQLIISNLSGSKTSAVASVTVLANPIFLVQPTATNGYLYKAVTFSPEVRGRAPVSYQWFRDGIAVTNQGTSRTLTVTNLLFSDAGNYTLVASNSLGVSTSSVASLTISILHGSVDLALDAKTFVNGGNGLTMLPDGRFYVAANYTSNAITLSRSVTRLLPDGRFDPTFVQTNNVVFAPRFMLVDSQGRLLCVTSSSVYRLLPNGVFDSTWGGTNLGLSHPNIQAAALQADGKLLLGGSYTSPRSYLFRLDENGKLDPTFNPNTFGAVFGLMVMSDGSIVAGATFNPNIRIQRFLPTGADYPGWTVSQYSGQSVGPTRFFELPDGKILAGGTWASRVQRFMPNGTLDTSFASPGLNPSATSYFEMLVERDGKIVVAGDFTTWNGFNVNGFVRLHPDGQYDSNFVGGATSPMQPLGLGQQYDGRLILVGNFTTFDNAARSRVAGAFSTPVTLGITNPPSSQIANLNSTVTLSATGWSATGANLTYQWYRNGSVIAGANSSTLQIIGIQKTQAGVYTVVVSDGTNSVTSPGAQVTVLAEPIFAVQPSSLITTQSFNVSFSPIVTGLQPMTFQWRWNGSAIAGATNLQLNLSSVTMANAGAYSLVVSNQVGSATSATAYLTVASLPAGSLDTTFQTNTGPNSSVNTIVLNTNQNSLVAGGFFTTWNGQSRQRLAWLDAETGALLGTNGPSLATLSSAALHTNGGLSIGGSFTTVGGQSRIGFARLQANGQLDTTVTNLLSSGSGVSVLAMHAYTNGSMLIGGYFRTAGDTVRSNLARVTAEGFVDPNFGASNFVNNGIWAMAVQSDGKILIGGDFTIVLGVPRTNFARLNADGTLDNTFTNAAVITSLFTRVSAIAIQSDGRIVIGGTFTSVSGQSRSYIARLNTNGSYDNTFTPTLNQGVSALAVIPGDKILVGGDFTVVNGVSCQRLVRLNANGTTDTSFNVGSGANQTVNVIVPLADGRVLIGGGFTSYNGISKPYLARLLGDGQLAPTIVAQPENVTAPPNATVSFSVAAGGLNPLRFQWRFNGTNLLNQTNFSLTLANVGTNQGGNYSVVITNGFGAITSSIASLTITAGGSPFDDWAAAAGLNAGNNQPGQDADNDGIVNAFEFYFGSNPASASPGAAPSMTSVNVSGTNYPATSFVRSKSASGVTLLPQASSTVTFTDSLGTSVHSVTDLGDGTERVVIRSSVGMNTLSSQFLRIQITIP